MDATINELSHTSISSFPTIKLYKKGDNTVVDYNGERTTEEFIKFIDAGGEIKGVPDVVSVPFHRIQCTFNESTRKILNRFIFFYPLYEQEEVEVDQSEEAPQKDEL